MGFYLDGAMEGKPPLPVKGKAECLVCNYDAQPLPYVALQLMKAFDVLPPDGRLVIVKEMTTHDAALVVDKREFAYLKEYPNELDPERVSAVFLLVPVDVVDALITGAGKPDWGQN